MHGHDYDLEQDFPNLPVVGWKLTSPVKPSNNCIGWALYDANQYWDGNVIGVRGYYWPPGVPKDDSIATWSRVFELHGYVVCKNGVLEPDVEKVAIYADAAQLATHVARQLESGAWTSKLGPDEDIEHNTVRGLEGDMYGTVAVYMKRPRLPYHGDIPS
jgi:hypothetical protein